jgi:hypothetical protein
VEVVVVVLLRIGLAIAARRTFHLRIGNTRPLGEKPGSLHRIGCEELEEQLLYQYLLVSFLSGYSSSRIVLVRSWYVAT